MANVDLDEIRALLQAKTEADRGPARKPLLDPLRTLIRPPRSEPAPRMDLVDAPRRVGLIPRPEAEAQAEEARLRTDPLQAAPPLTLRRNAFGLRSGQDAPREATLALPAPAHDRDFNTLVEPAPRPRPETEAAPAALLDEADVGEAMRRLGSRLARAAATATAETPYMPEDLTDDRDPETDRYFADAELFDAPSPASHAPPPGPDVDPRLAVDVEVEPSFEFERDRDFAPPAPARAQPALARPADRIPIPEPANDAGPQADGTAEAELLAHLERVLLAEQAALGTRSA